MPSIWTFSLGVASIAVASTALVSCSDNSSNNAQLEISGTALSVLNKTAQPDRPFVVLDLSKTGAEQQVASGSSDAQGNFSLVLLEKVSNLIVAFPPAGAEPRTSGLISLLESNQFNKTLDDATDLACGAGAAAVGDQSLAASDLDRTRIANLESGATRVLETRNIDFTDAESVSAGVVEVRQITRDGAFGLDKSAEVEIRGSVLSVLDKVAQPDRNFVVLDLAKTGEEQVIAQGISDALGNFLIKVGGDVTNIIVAFPPQDNEPRSSGLLSLIGDDNSSKSLEDFTDIACGAGAAAVGDGSIASSQLDNTRIANLEQGATRVLSEQSVDFTNPDSVAAAVARVRELTQDGAQAPN